MSLHDYSQIQIVDAVTEQEEDEVANPIKKIKASSLEYFSYESIFS